MGDSTKVTERKKSAKTNEVNKNCEIMESGDHNRRPTTELTNLGPMDFSYESDDFQFEDEDVKPDVNRLETSSASSGPEQTNVQVNKRKKKKPQRVQPSLQCLSEFTEHKSVQD